MSCECHKCHDILFITWTLGKEKIRVLLADREFIGEEWFRFLIEQEIPFIIRIKQNSMVEGIRQGYAVPVATLLEKLGQRAHDRCLKPRIFFPFEIVSLEMGNRESI